MPTAQCTRAKPPKQQEAVRSVTQPTSLRLMQNLLSTTVGCIAYIRGLFSEDHFVDFTLNSLQLKGLRRGRSPEADQLANWIEHGVYDALARKYLHTLVLGIYMDAADPDNVVESFTFRFQYESDAACQVHHSGPGRAADHSAKPLARFESRRDISDATMGMLRSLILLNQTLRPLQKPCYVTMKLYYYAHTPHDYEPECFKSATSAHFGFGGRPRLVQLGRVPTPFHELSLCIHSMLDDAASDDGDHSPPAETEPPLAPNARLLATQPSPVDTAARTGSDAAEPDSSSELWQPCICGSRDMNEVSVQCDQCQHYWHSSCQGFLRAEDVSESEPFICSRCSRGIPSGQAALREEQILAQRRRTIALAYAGRLCTFATLSELFGVTNSRARTVVQGLVRQGLLLRKGDTANGPAKFECPAAQTPQDAWGHSQSLVSYFPQSQTAWDPADQTCSLDRPEPASPAPTVDQAPVGTLNKVLPSSDSSGSAADGVAPIARPSGNLRRRKVSEPVEPLSLYS